MPAARPREAVMQAGATECAIDTAAGAATSARRRNSHGNARRQPPLPHTNKFKSGNSTRKLNLAQQIANGLKTQGHWPPSLGRCQRMKGLGGTAEQRFELFRAMHRRQGAAAISNTSATVEGDSGAARAAQITPSPAFLFSSSSTSSPSSSSPSSSSSSVRLRSSSSSSSSPELRARSGRRSAGAGAGCGAEKAAGRAR